MDDKILTTLSEMPIPVPPPESKARAIQAGVQAFVESRDQIARATQEIGPGARPMSSFVHRLWEALMEHRLAFGSALASLLIVSAVSIVLYKKVEEDRIRSISASFAGGAPSGPVDQRRAEALASADSAQVTDPPADAGETVASLPNAEALTVRPDVSRPVPDARKVAVLPEVAPLPPRDIGSAYNRRSFAHSMDQSLEVLSDQRPRVSARAGRDLFQAFESNPTRSVAEHPVSTFSVDVDTASYAFLRRSLTAGVLPPASAVRVEEMINYFAYDYPRPADPETPFSLSVTISPTPWNPHSKLLQIGIMGHENAIAAKPRSNLVFLIDVSGSMSSPDKLPLVKTALRLLVDGLEAEDSVAIVTYAGAAGTALEPTKVVEKRKIFQALDRLSAGGSTAGDSGIRQAYALAEAAFEQGGVNRVILATDGDFNVGPTDIEQLTDLIKKKRRSGIYLSALGFGQGNYNDALMQSLAQNGNGNAAYIDSLREAHKVLVEEASSMLYPIAKDVKLQIEFNPARISEYRLIGYETRALKRTDFGNDLVDAGEVSSGHRVTAIYEITPAGSPQRLVEDLRYRASDAPVPARPSDEYAFLKLRYKLPRETTSRLIDFVISSDLERPSLEDLSHDRRFAVAVAAFGQKLRGNPELDDFSYDRILQLATSARGADPQGYRAEFLTLVRLAQALGGAD